MKIWICILSLALLAWSFLTTLQLPEEVIKGITALSAASFGFTVFPAIWTYQHETKKRREAV